MQASSIRVTPEARAALDRLPAYVMVSRFLQHFDLIPCDLGNVAIMVSESTRPQNRMHTRSIRIINLVNAYIEQLEVVEAYDIANL